MSTRFPEERQYITVLNERLGKGTKVYHVAAETPTSIQDIRLAFLA